MDNILAKYSTIMSTISVEKLLCARVKTLRKKAKWSQAELANRSQVSLGSIKRFESSGKISLESLLKIVQVLGRLEDFQNLLIYDDTLDRVKKRFDG